MHKAEIRVKAVWSFLQLYFQHLDFSENILLNNLGHITTFCVMKCKYFA